jgi:excisionase family DNA binding protein
VRPPAEDAEPSPLWTREQAASYLGVHKDTIRNMQQRDELSTVMISGMPRVPELEVKMAAIRGTVR